MSKVIGTAKPNNKTKEVKMLLMSIVTWEPEKRDEVVKRFAEKGTMRLLGRKVIGTWNDIGEIEFSDWLR